ncbi:unnamed protein product, partial [Hapterophycus canaliculatus]
MHSLKELRAENAARRLSNNRTEDEDEGERTPLAVGAETSSAGVQAAAATSRAGRTLAPLGSAGSLRPSGTAAPAESAADSAAQEQEDREARRRRRLRRRREREQRENYDSGNDNGKANDDNATAASGIPRTRTPMEEEGGRRTEERRPANDDVAVGEGELQPGREGDSERKGELLQEESDRRSSPAAASFAGEERVLRDANSAHPRVDDEGSEKPPISARGAPPSEKPRKNLTPLEARRARIEQQKRAEAEREAGVSGQSPRSADSEQSREAVEAKSDSRSQGGAVDVDGRGLADETGLRSGNSLGTSRKGQPRNLDDSSGSSGESGAKIEVGAKGVISPASKSEEVGVGGIERSVLNSSDSVARKQPEGGRDNAKGDQAETAKERDPGERKTQELGDGDEAGAAALGRGADDLPEDTVSGDGGRFQGMRSRMKKAGKGLMTKKAPPSSARREKGVDDEGVVGTRDKNEEQPEPAGETSSGDTVPGTGDEGRGGRVGVGRRNESQGSRAAGGRNPTGDPADNSDTEGETVKEGDDFDTDSDENAKGREKKWGRKKEKGSADLPQAGDKEVTLGHVVDRKMREMGYIRKPPVDELKNRRSLRDRVAAEEAPEVHFIGEISGAEGFGSGISCRFRVEGGRHWTCLAGLEEGQTHVMNASYGETFAPWNHPIDLHYTTKSIQGWPRLMLQVWQLDTHGRNVLRGYGFRHLPSTPGFSQASVPCWRPSGNMQ